MKKLFVTLFAVVACLAVAQNAGQGARGRGVAVNENQVRGAFMFEVLKFQREGSEPVVRGNLQFRSENRIERFLIQVDMLRVRQAAFANPLVCEFDGPGVIVRRAANTEPRRVEGRVVVRVQDRRSNGSGEPDLFRIQFFNRNNEEIYRFQGRVLDGDIVVRM